MVSSNAGENRKAGTFAKGDKRINRKGRPKTFDAARALAQDIAHETIANNKGETVTVTEAILRKWASSNDPRLQMYFFEIAYGKAPIESRTKNENINSGTMKYEYIVDAQQAGNIFDILTSVGAVQTGVGDSEAE